MRPNSMVIANNSKNEQAVVNIIDVFVNSNKKYWSSNWNVCDVKLINSVLSRKTVYAAYCNLAKHWQGLTIQVKQYSINNQTLKALVW